MKRTNTFIENSGISILVLVITILVMIILAGAVISNTGNTVSSVNKVNFANELQIVTEKTQEYYVQNSSFPVIPGTEALSLSQVLALSGLKNEDKNVLLSEMDEAKDNYDNIDIKKFYVIDLSKLDVTKTLRGSKINGDNDIFIISDTMKVYYLKGNVIENQIYFSLSSKLIEERSVEHKESEYTTIITSNITVKKEKNTWSNNLGLKVKVNIEDSETLDIKLPNTDEKKFTLNNGLNEFSINFLEELISENAVIKVSNMTQEEINTFKSLPQKEKNIEFIKRKNNVEIGRVKIDLSNYETELPTYDSSNINLISQSANNILELFVNDNISGIKDVRYEYLTRYDADGNLVNYYDNLSINETYLLSRGKKAVISNQNKANIILPKDVNSVKVLIADNAGNTNLFNIENTLSSIYMGLVPNTLLLTNVNFKINTVLSNVATVSNIATYISIDDGAFNNEVLYNVPQDSKKFTLDCKYDNIQNAKNKISIKIVAYDKSMPKKILETSYINFTKDTQIGKVEEPQKNYDVKYTIEKWISGGSYYYNVNISITNLTSSNVNGWNLEMNFPSNTSVSNIWNANYNIQNQRIVFSNVSYNSVIESGKTISYGLQIKDNTGNFYPTNIKFNNEIIPGENPEDNTPVGNIQVDFYEQSRWQSGGNYYYSYNVDVTNKTNKALISWSLDLILDSTTNISQIWNAKYIKSSGKATISNVDYNGNISVNGKVTFGVIIETKNNKFSPITNNLTFK